VAHVAVCRVDELPEAVPTVVRAGERELALIRWRDDVYALRNLCPHMSASFERGPVSGRITGRVGGVEISDDDPVIMCPWHQYEFSLGTGRCVTDAKLRVRSYKVIVRDGTVLVDLAKPRPAARVLR
jgi:nitrite reductase (NADH) small subunit